MLRSVQEQQQHRPSSIFNSSSSFIEAKECDLAPDNEIFTTSNEIRSARRKRRGRRRKIMTTTTTAALDMKTAPTTTTTLTRHKRALFMMSSIVMLILITTATRQHEAALPYSSTPSQQQQQPSSIASLQQSLAQLLQVFNGNETAPESNHFKLLERQGDFVLVGGRNVVYNLSLSTMREQRRLEWPSMEEDVRMCRVKGKSVEQCQNYIRVLKLQAPDSLFVCGTNAYKPKCRTYAITSNAYELVSEQPGEGDCPYQETQNVTSLFADGSLYSATAAQFSGIDGLIHRAPLRTEQFNAKQLNSPNFVSSFRYGEHVYFLFREIAIEHINCGKTIYSRIARVCINDLGGSTRANQFRWTSFVKARLNCSIPSEFPFYFDEIQASTHVLHSESAQMAPHPSSSSSSSSSGSSSSSSSSSSTTSTSQANNDLLYAVFTTPTNSIGGSAICAYRMADVLAAFEGPFKSQADSNSNWLPVPESRVPIPRPGTCVNESKRLADENINFIKENPLMDQAVEPIWSQPLIMMASINFRFTQIAVDAQVETHLVPGAAHMRTDVIFVSTDDGRVFKLTNTYHLYQQAAAAASQSVSVAPLAAAQVSLGPQQQQQQHHPHHRPATGSVGQLPLASSVQMAMTMMAAGSSQVKEPLPDISGNTIVIEELHLFDSRTPIVNLMIHYPRPNQDGYAKLIVLAGKQLKAVPLSRCERALTCADCLALYDPYCAWDARQQLCLNAGRSMSWQLYGGSSMMSPPGSLPYRSTSSSPVHSAWFPANNNIVGSSNPQLQQQQYHQTMSNNYTLGWWSQCPPPMDPMQGVQAVGAPYRSLFSSHLQVPNRFDYASGHHLAHSALVALAPPTHANPPLLGHRTQPASECLTFCGGLYAPASQMSSPMMSPATDSSMIGNCADYVQQHYIGGSSGGLLMNPQMVGSLVPNTNQASGSSSYSSENLYFAVIICAVSGLILGLLFGFAIGRNTKKHDSSVCSSTFDETNLYMASTGSHGPSSLFAPPTARLGHHLLQQQQQQQHQHQQHHSLRPSGLVNQHLFEAGQCLLGQDSSSPGAIYGNSGHQQQQMLLQLQGANYANDTNNRNASNIITNNSTTHRSGALPPIPGATKQQQQAPLVNTNNPGTLINHSQLTPNSIGSNSTSTNTSSTSATVPANEQQQFYLNQQQLLMQQQQHHQRSLSDASSQQSSKGSLGTSGARFMISDHHRPPQQQKLAKQPQTFLQQQLPQQQHQQLPQQL